MSDNEIDSSSLICLALMRLGTRMATKFDTWFLEQGVTQAQFRLLLSVYQLAGRDNSVTPSALADALFIERPTVTVLIARLVESGLLVRVADPADHRSYGLRLTPEGGAVLSVMGPVANTKAKNTLAIFDADEQRTLLALLGRLETFLRSKPPL